MEGDRLPPNASCGSALEILRTLFQLRGRRNQHLFPHLLKPLFLGCPSPVACQRVHRDDCGTRAVTDMKLIQPPGRMNTDRPWQRPYSRVGHCESYFSLELARYHELVSSTRPPELGNTLFCHLKVPAVTKFFEIPGGNPEPTGLDIANSDCATFPVNGRGRTRASNPGDRKAHGAKAGHH